MSLTRNLLNTGQWITVIGYAYSALDYYPSKNSCLVSLVCVCTTILLISCSQNQTEISFEQAWIRAPLPSRTTSAAYVRITNPTKESVTFTVANSDTIGAIEFHKSVLRDGLHRMVKLETLEVPAEDSLDLAPGGLHLMLFRIQEVDGGQHTIDFHTENERTFQVVFELRARASE